MHSLLSIASCVASLFSLGVSLITLTIQLIDRSRK
jgi:hypothetical protein